MTPVRTTSGTGTPGNPGAAEGAAAEPVRFPLALRPLAAPVHRPAAWFVPGDDPRAWLDEIARWGVPMAGLRLYVVPASVRDRSPVGVLVVVPIAGGGGAVTPAPSPRAQAYGLLGGRLYVPADAALDPPVSDAELSTVLVWPVQVLHPSAGLSGFGADDALTVADLLAPPARRDVDWDRASPGVAPAPRLAAVDPVEVPTIRAIFGEAADDIGAEPAGELPPAPDESRVRDAMRRAGRPPVKFLQWLAGRAGGDKAGQKAQPGGAAGGAGGTGGKESLAGKLSSWAGRTLAGMSQEIEAARHRELQRLQKLLESDPDQGLRYAIPLRGTGGTRGVAPPGANLAARDPDFDLSHLGGGRRGDAWSVPWDIQQQLVARYREAANRELNLGRHRRAAYIFAELLGDYPAAASALEQGRHYREAATLYRTYLQNPARAADCLERGGLLSEAAALYEELNEHEKAGDVHARIDRPDDAARCYRTAVDRLLVMGNRLPAAKLLEAKLTAPDEALGVLAGGWDAGEAPAACLREWFALAGRLGRHDAAADRVRAFRDAGAVAPDRVASLAGVLAAVATTYPNPAARPLAADVTRVVAGRRLAVAEGREKAELVEAVTKLAPEDRLLVRDGNRFLAKKTPPPAVAGPSAPATRAGKPDELRGPVVVHQFRLPDHVDWRHVAGRGGEFYALGFTKGAAAGYGVILRGRWDGRTQAVPWRHPPRPDRDARLAPSPSLPHVSVVPGPFAELLVGAKLPPPPAAGAVSFVLPATDAFPEKVEVGTPGWLRGADGRTSLAYDENGVAWVLAVPADDEADVGTLWVFQPESASILATYSLDLTALQTRPSHAAHDLVVRRGQAFVACRDGVVRTDGRATVLLSTPRSVTGLAASAPFTRVRVAATTSEGGVVFWDDDTRHPFGDGLFDPRAAFTRGGLLVALTPDEGRVYRTDNGAVAHHATFKGPGAPLLALVPTSRINSFAVFTADGLVRVYQIPV